MNIFFASLLVTWVQCFFNKIESFDKENTTMDIMEMVKYHGYPILQYRVTTADGYILTLNRIPGKKGSKEVNAVKQAPKKSVLLNHGLMMNA